MPKVAIGIDVCPAYLNSLRIILHGLNLSKKACRKIMVTLLFPENMSSTTKTKKLVLLENMTHYLTAMVVILKGFDKINIPGKLWYGVLFLGIGILIIGGTLFHHKAEKLLKHFKAYVLIFEAIVMTTVGYLYWKEGKQLIQYVCFAAAAMFVVALVIYIRKKRLQPSVQLH
jgi:hypothetical protein